MAATLPKEHCGFLGSLKGSWILGEGRCSLLSQSIHNLVPCLVLLLITVYVHSCGLLEILLGLAKQLLSPLMLTTLTQLGLWDVDQSNTGFLCLNRYFCLARDAGSAFQESAFPKVLELSIQCVLGEDLQDITPHTFEATS